MRTRATVKTPHFPLRVLARCRDGAHYAEMESRTLVLGTGQRFFAQEPATFSPVVRGSQIFTTSAHSWDLFGWRAASYSPHGGKTLGLLVDGASC